MQKILFHKMVNQRRIEKNITNKQLANMTGISKTHCTEITAGRALPFESGAKRIAEILEFSLDEVYFAPRPDTDKILVRLGRWVPDKVPHISQEHADFGMKLRERRLELNMTTREAARRIGTSRSIVNTLENGNSFPNGGTLSKYIKVLELEVNKKEIDALYREAREIFKMRAKQRGKAPYPKRKGVCKTVPKPEGLLFTDSEHHPLRKIIKEKRETLGLTLKQVAEKIGATKNAVTSMEIGLSVMLPERLEKLEKLYGLDLEALDLKGFRWLCAQKSKKIVQDREIRNEEAGIPTRRQSKWDNIQYKDHKGQVALSRGAG